MNDIYDMMKANPKSEEDVQDPEPEKTKCVKTDIFHDIQVKVRRQDSTYQDVYLGDLFGS